MEQLSFLHVYHHLTIFMFYWVNANIGYDGEKRNPQYAPRIPHPPFHPCPAPVSPVPAPIRDITAAHQGVCGSRCCYFVALRVAAAPAAAVDSQHQLASARCLMKETACLQQQQLAGG